MKKIIPDDLSKWKEEETFIEEDKLILLKALLTIPAEDRTREDCFVISDAVKKFKFFNPYKDSQYFQELCRYLKIEQYSPNDIVFRQGDRGDCLYFILEGLVSVNVNLPPDSTGKSAGIRELVKLPQGAIFGELALMQESPRTATVIIIEPTDLMILEKSAFQKFIKDPKALNLHKIKGILTSVPALANISDAKLEELANKSILKKFDTNTLLIKQQSLVKYFCFVKNGFMKIYRSINFRIDLSTKEINGDITDPTAEELEAGLYKSITLELTEIGASEMFGEHAAAHKKPIDYSVITVIPSDIILIKVRDFKEILGSLLFEMFKKDCRNYPMDEELRRKYYSQKGWNQMRLDVIRKTIQVNVHKKSAKERLLDIYEEEKEDPREVINRMRRNSQIMSKKLQPKDSLQSSVFSRDLPPVSFRNNEKSQKTLLLPPVKNLKSRSQSVSRLQFGGMR